MGNRLRGDDSIALLVADELKEFNIKKAYSAPESFITKPIDKLILIDAVDFPGDFGEVKLIKKDDIEKQINSTHNSSSIIMDLVKKLYIVGIKPKSTDFSEELSDELKTKFNQICIEVKTILKEISKE